MFNEDDVTSETIWPYDCQNLISSGAHPGYLQWHRQCPRWGFNSGFVQGSRPVEPRLAFLSV